MAYHHVEDAAPTLGCRIRRWLLAMWVVGGPTGAAWLAASQSSWWMFPALLPLFLLMMLAATFPATTPRAGTID